MFWWFEDYGLVEMCCMEGEVVEIVFEIFLNLEVGGWKGCVGLVLVS